MLESQVKEGSVVDSLYGLEGNPLFWFLTKDRLDQIQHQLLTESVILKGGDGRGGVSIFAETLASVPERKLNEDSFMILPIGEGRILFAVLDGASSQEEISGLAPYRIIRGAFYIANLVALGFKNSPEYEELTRRETLTAGEVMKSMNGWIFREMQKVPGVDYNDVLTVPGMAVTSLLLDASGEITMAHVADTCAAAFYTDGRIEILTPNQNEKFDKETLELFEKLAREYGCSLARVERIREAKAKVRAHIRDSFVRKINKPNGCGILNGMPELITNRLIFERKVRISGDLSKILLFSDGALLPYLESGISVESAVKKLADSLKGNQGNGSVLKAGAARLENDPEFEVIHRHKHRDDATIIEISLNKQ